MEVVVRLLVERLFLFLELFLALSFLYTLVKLLVHDRVNDEGQETNHQQHQTEEHGSTHLAAESFGKGQ